ncbi:MAG TPA: hypothetical protein VMU25_01145 [Candidatus Paceibacterota bacterium]|nr:hypothetical protein [Candidatus Paceibacterota bacterium]
MRRRKRRVIVLIGLLMFFGIGAGAISYASYLPRYSVQTIDVEGAQSIPAETIRAYADAIIHDGSRHFISRANIFMFPKVVLENDIAADFPRIASVKVTRPSLLSTTMTITVAERQLYALWCDATQSCYSMDQSGFIFAPALTSASSTGAYIFTGGIATSSNPIGQTFAAGHMPGLVVFLQRLGQSGYSPMGAVVKNDQDFEVPLIAGLPGGQDFSIYASFGEDPDTLINNLQLILSSSALAGKTQDLEYIDLRFGDKVYYKLKGEAQTQASSTKTH